MTKVNPFSGIYIKPPFINLMNAQYYPASAMQASVQKLIALKGAAWVKAIKYGDYQTLLTSTAQWAPDAAKAWPQSMIDARNSLSTQKNVLPIMSGSATTPATKCDLLDSIVNYCFNTALPGAASPGIPMVIDVQQKSSIEPGNAIHDVHVSWTYVNGVPVQLNWTMVCPYS
jgi:hypothetical protein